MVFTRCQTSSARRLKVESQQARERFLKLEGRGEQLLQGIPNEITLQQVAPKLSWTDFYALSLVSSYWRDAIRSHHVYNARMQSHSTEKFVLVKYGKKKGAQTFPVLVLLNLKDDSMKELAPLLHFRRPGIPYNCQSVTLDGKIYVLGGVATVTDDGVGSNRVYMLDVAAGQRQWKECARMQHGRQAFVCSILNGKIYVFGGYSSGAEAYDPKEDIWSSITLSTSLRVPLKYYDTAVGMGEEVLVFSNFNHLLPVCVYHPAKDEWRVLTSFVSRRREGPIFRAQGKLCVLSYHHIHVYDVHENSWTQLHSSSFAGFGEQGDVDLHDALIVDEEILAVITSFEPYPRSLEYFVVRSTGFGSKNETITWQIVLKCDIPSVGSLLLGSGGWKSNFLRTIQL